MFEDGLAMDAEAPASEKGSDDYSETNNQVEGVDEMDKATFIGKFFNFTKCRF